MSPSFCVLRLPCLSDQRLRGWGPSRRAKGLARLFSGVALAAASIAAPASSIAAVDWAECLHAVDPDVRAAACTDIIGNTRDRKTLLRALNGRGNALCATDRCREAVPDFTSVVRLAPDVAGYHDNLARALRAATRYPEALQESEQAIDLAPKLAFVYVGKARTLAAAGRGDEALAVVRIAMAVAPVDAGLLEYQGKLLGDLKRYPESYAAFDRALQMQPTRASVYVRRADVEAADGRSADAIRDLERYPADGAEFYQVTDKLNALRTPSTQESANSAKSSNLPGKPDVVAEINDEKDLYDAPKADGRSATPAPGVAAPPPTIGETCNLYEWKPLRRCIEDYHNENDPLPGGVPNPRRWNDELAAHGLKLAKQHPEIVWNNAIWAELAEAASSEDKPRTRSAPQSPTSTPRMRYVPSSDAAALSAQALSCLRRLSPPSTSLAYSPSFMIKIDAKGYLLAPPDLLNQVESNEAARYTKNALSALIKCQPYPETKEAPYAAKYQFSHKVKFNLHFEKTHVSTNNSDRLPASARAEAAARQEASENLEREKLIARTQIRSLEEAAAAIPVGSEAALDCASAANKLNIYSIFAGHNTNEEALTSTYQMFRLSAFTTLDKGPGFRRCQVYIERLFINKAATFVVRASDDHATQTLSDLY